MGTEQQSATGRPTGCYCTCKYNLSASPAKAQNLQTPVSRGAAWLAESEFQVSVQRLFTIA